MVEIPWNLPLFLGSFSQALDRLRARILSGEGGYACFINVHTFEESLERPALLESFRESYLNFPDGMPLVWWGKLHGRKLEKVSGPDVFATLTTDFSIPHALLGGSPETLKRLEWIPGPKFSPPFRPTPEGSFSEEVVLEDLRALAWDETKPLAVWVGLGAPKQELWMRVASRLRPRWFFLGVGAAFDYHSGKVSRAPVWMQQAGLEWFSRLLSEPRRLGPRYIQTNLKFLGRLLGLKRNS
jgi:N-acetylglucosaminyldiphosphoundecaprenol N-acetyl-beta-D-mannosaminyltransferase